MFVFIDVIDSFLLFLTCICLCVYVYVYEEVCVYVYLRFIDLIKVK